MDDKQNSVFELNEVINTLKKSADERNAIELDRFQQQTKDIPFFKQYINQGDKDVHFKCCKFMKYEFVKKDETVFLIDSIGSKFYLILQGKAGVYIRLPKKIQNEDPNSPGKEEDNSLTCVKVLNSGEAFGELALLNNKPRLASIIAHENTYLAVLDKKDFVLILKEKEEQKLLKEMGFFAKLPFFTGWNFNLVKLLYLNAFRVKYKKGDFVFQEGQEPVAVYIITEGQFDLEKTFDKEKRPEFWETENQKDIKQMRLVNKKAKMILRIASYTPHELFGEEDIMNQQQKRTFGAVCESANGECIMIKKRDFYIRILREEGAKQYLKQRLLNKNNRMQEKIKSIKDSIYGFQNFLYNDQNGLKKQKEQSQEIFKNENFNDGAIKKFVNHSGNHLEKDSSNRELASPTEVSSPSLNPSQSKYGIRRSVTSFMNLFPLNTQIDHNTPIIPMFEQKRQSLATRTEQFSPLLKQQKQQQGQSENRNMMKLYSSSNINQEALTPQKGVLDINDKDSRKSDYLISSPTSKPISQTLIKRFSGVFDEDKFNNFKLTLKKNLSSNSDKEGQSPNKLSKQNTIKLKEGGIGSFQEIPDILQQTNTTGINKLGLPTEQMRNSILSIPVGTQTIIENDYGNENSSGDEGPSSCASPESPQLKKYLTFSPQRNVGKISTYLNSNHKKENTVQEYSNTENVRSYKQSILAHRFSNSEKKLQIFENIKFKSGSSNTLQNFNMLSDETRYQKDDSRYLKEDSRLLLSNPIQAPQLPRIVINKESNSPFEKYKTTLNDCNSTKSLGQDEFNQYKKAVPSNFSQIYQDQSSLIYNRQSITQSVERAKKSSLYFNQIIQSKADDFKRTSMRQTTSLERQQFSTPQNKLLKQHNSIITISQTNIQNQSISPSQKIKSFGQTLTKSRSETKNQLLKKQPVQAGQRIVDIMDRMLLKQQENSQRTLENIQINSISNNNKDEIRFQSNTQNCQKKLPIKVTDQNNKGLHHSKEELQNSFFNGFKYHVSIGTQFSSLIKQLDQSKLSVINQSNQTEKSHVKQQVKIRHKN